MNKDGIIVNVIGMDEKEAEIYVDQAIQKYGNRLKEVTVQPDPDDNDYVAMNYKLTQPFERIRRITGYLVGTLDRWGNAKRSEERDRVKHDSKQ